MDAIHSIPSSLKTFVSMTDMYENTCNLLEDPHTKAIYLERCLGNESEFFVAKDSEVTLFTILRWAGMDENANVGILKSSADASILSDHLLHLPLRCFSDFTFEVIVWNLAVSAEVLPLLPVAPSTSDLPVWPAIWDLLDMPADGNTEKTMAAWYDQISYNAPSPALVM